MKNLEIKAKCTGHFAAISALRKLNAENKGILKQRDVYFRISPGRLKLRSINREEHQLIYYRRPDRKSARFSNYFLEKIRYPGRTEKILGNSLGKLVTVNKKRVLYIYENVRIHLDTVGGLGKFIEIEIVCKTASDTRSAAKKMKMLTKVLGIKYKDHIKVSYSDMILFKKTKQKIK